MIFGKIVSLHITKLGKYLFYFLEIKQERQKKGLAITNNKLKKVNKYIKNMNFEKFFWIKLWKYGWPFFDSG